MVNPNRPGPNFRWPPSSTTSESYFKKPNSSAKHLTTQSRGSERPVAQPSDKPYPKSILKKPSSTRQPRTTNIDDLSNIQSVRFSDSPLDIETGGVYQRATPTAQRNEPKISARAERSYESELTRLEQKHGAHYTREAIGNVVKIFDEMERRCTQANSAEKRATARNYLNRFAAEGTVKKAAVESAANTLLEDPSINLDILAYLYQFCFNSKLEFSSETKLKEDEFIQVSDIVRNYTKSHSSPSTDLTCDYTTIRMIIEIAHELQANEVKSSQLPSDQLAQKILNITQGKLNNLQTMYDDWVRGENTTTLL